MQNDIYGNHGHRWPTYSSDHYHWSILARSNVRHNGGHHLGRRNNQERQKEMKLRNKKTGDIGINEGEDIEDKRFCIRSEKTGHIYVYDSLAELNKEWEDYKPAEPLTRSDIQIIKEALMSFLGQEKLVGLDFEQEVSRIIKKLDREGEK